MKTVEEELENALYKLNYISECNYGVLQKIDWARASRTDKRVSAVFNMVSCKLHKLPDKDEESLKSDLNQILPKDIRIFQIIEVSKNFSAWESNNNREYHYILPTFMLQPNALNPIDYSKISIDDLRADYTYRLTPEYHEKIKEICKFFRGTKKYHNYTKKLSFNDGSAQRHIYEFSCDEIMHYDNFEAIKFKIIGQSFLYNQIRKMVGMVVEVCREGWDKKFLENTVLANKMDIPKAPAEGLYLYWIDFSKYNNRKQTKKNCIDVSEETKKEMDDFKGELVKIFENAEKESRIYSKWLWKYYNQKENTY